MFPHILTRIAVIPHNASELSSSSAWGSRCSTVSVVLSQNAGGYSGNTAAASSALAIERLLEDAACTLHTIRCTLNDEVLRVVQAGDSGGYFAVSGDGGDMTYNHVVVSGALNACLRLCRQVRVAVSAHALPARWMPVLVLVGGHTACYYRSCGRPSR